MGLLQQQYYGIGTSVRLKQLNWFPPFQSWLTTLQPRLDITVILQNPRRYAQGSSTRYMAFASAPLKHCCLVSRLLKVEELM